MFPGLRRKKLYRCLRGTSTGDLALPQFLQHRFGQSARHADKGARIVLIALRDGGQERVRDKWKGTLIGRLYPIEVRE